ncbi:MAG: protein arginine kinase [Firmicutes bacterium]|nr:protein arginine kinase [Bacillota bacterium]
MNGKVNMIPDHDVIVSSRVRLARNFSQYPFPSKMNSKQAEEIIGNVKDAILNYYDAEIGNLLFVDIGSLGNIDKQMLVEKHLISPDLAASTKRSAAIISKNENISIMINEEDHLRIQVLFPGMQIDNAWKLCDKIDDILDKKIEFAYSNVYGYLTCCPTNLGTGIRASVMLHLPALVMTGYIRNILEACGKLNIAVRGMYGEHSEAIGNMFQMSNQITLGQTEEEIISSIKNIATQIVEQEKALRNELYRQNTIKFEDKIYRSFGILANARTISTEESLRLISDVRLGIDLGIIKDINTDTLNEIMLSIQPACLQKLLGRPLDSNERDIRRAELIRMKLKKS